MNLFRIFTALALLGLIGISSCKKDKKPVDVNTTETTTEKLTTIINLHQGAGVKYEEVLATTHDSVEALVEMAKWIITQPEVEKATLIDDYIVAVHFKNGLKSSIAVIPTDNNGKHLTRGGGGGSALYRSTSDDYLIANKKAVVFIPFFEEFYYGSYPHKAKLENGGKHKLTVDLFTDNDATLAVMNTFKDYGLIIINTHGQKNSIEIKTQVPELDVPKKPDGTAMTAEEVTAFVAASNNLPLESIENGDLEIAFKIEKRDNDEVFVFHGVSVTENYIRKLPGLTDAVVFGNHCYSGYTYDGPNKNNMMEAWKSIGAVAYYGYAFNDKTSMGAHDEFCQRMEDSLITNLIDGDSTGLAHLANDITQQDQATFLADYMHIQVDVTTGLTAAQYSIMGMKPKPGPFYFMHFINPRYKYGCGTFTDPRDGEVYELACIGNQTWMAENLRHAGGGAGICYDNNAANCEKFGRMYSIVEATGLVKSDANPSGVQGICPEGWHVPSRAEWQELFDFCGGGEEAKKKLRATTDWAQPHSNTDELGFNLLPSGGYVMQPSNGNFSFTGLGTSSVIWTTSANPGGTSYYGMVNMDFFLYSPPTSDMVWKFPCRCVKD